MLFFLLLLLQAISRLSPREAYDRAFRLRQAQHMSVLHRDLPKDQWLSPADVSTRTLKRWNSDSGKSGMEIMVLGVELSLRK